MISRRIREVEDIIHIMAACSCQEMPMPGVLEAIFLEDLIVRNAAFNTLAEIIDGRRWQ
jgi:hypothetical protein